MSPYQCYTFAKNQRSRIQEYEPTIARSGQCSYLYAKEIIKNRFFLGEIKIAENCTWAYLYAKNIVRGRFPEGELIISKSCSHAFRYAHHIIKERFILGESAIIKDQYFWKLYKEKYLQYKKCEYWSIYGF